MITQTPLSQDSDIVQMRDLLYRLPNGDGVVDFEEAIQLPEVRPNICLWHQDDHLIAFAYVDNYDNLWFALDPACLASPVPSEIVAWGLACLRRRNQSGATGLTLDAVCRADDHQRLALLEKFGFVRGEERSLQYSRSLNEPVQVIPCPPGFQLRSVRGEEEVDDLVTLHRAAFGTDQMTVAQRLAIMRAPQYDPSLDLVAVAPGGELAGFCTGGIDPSIPTCGTTDPVGVHPGYRRLGLGKALLSAALQALKARGVKTVTFGTSSQNLPMRRLGEAARFVVVSEKLWLSRPVER